MTLAPGRQLGPYQVLAPLGAGGMGVVYRAFDRRLEREIAIKVLPAHLSQDPAALARFEREAKALAAISHPHILAVFDVGTDQGLAFVVTELLQGESLQARIGPAPLAWKESVELALAVSSTCAGSTTPSNSTGERSPSIPPSRASTWTSGWRTVQQGFFSQGIDEIRKGIDLLEQSPGLLATLGYAYGRAGDRAEAERILEELQALSKRHHVSSYSMALVHVGLAAADQAFAWLEKSLVMREDSLVSLLVNPRVDPLRSDPRFPALLDRIGLAPSGPASSRSSPRQSAR